MNLNAIESRFRCSVFGPGDQIIVTFSEDTSMGGLNMNQVGVQIGLTAKGKTLM